MITPMKKVTVLTVADAVEETLQALRTLEILHLTPLQAAAGAKLNKARGEMNRVQKALEVVPEKAPKGVTPVNPSALRQAQGPIPSATATPPLQSGVGFTALRLRQKTKALPHESLRQNWGHRV